jgi:hypothetical protein
LGGKTSWAAPWARCGKENQRAPSGCVGLRQNTLLIPFPSFFLSQLRLSLCAVRMVF